jgi:hypothetical protein
MSALGDVPCGSCRACCRHDLIPLMPERGDLVWTYEHEVIATPDGLTAVLRCANGGECIYSGSGRLHYPRTGPGGLQSIRLQGLVPQQNTR